MDNEKIIQTVTAVFSGADEHNWKKIQNVMFNRVLLDYTSMVGGTPSSLTPGQITDAWAAFLPGFEKTHHQLSGFRITVTDNAATARYSGKADHFIGNDVWTVEGTYDTELVKSGGQWLVSEHRFNLLKQSGTTDLAAEAAKRMNHKKAATTRESIQFTSDGLVIAGNLYKPADFDPAKEYPAVLVGGSWTTVKEQMSGLYAEKLSEKGFVTLAIDPRYFGESEGQPRFWENPEAKIADYKKAITYLETVQGVDANRIFLAAVCAGAGYMATVAAEDSRAKGLALIAAWLHDAEAVKLFYGGHEGVQARIRQAREAKRMFAKTGEVAYIPAISKTDANAAMVGDFDYYLNTDRGAVPQWSADKFAVMSWEDWLTFNPMPVAKNIQVPTLMIHSDGAVLAGYAKQFYNDIPHNNKVLHWTEGTQFDFYDQPALVAEAVTAMSVFFKNHLN
jgi:fermentation-respiration switch protein FrsA (DUF1100 family)